MSGVALRTVRLRNLLSYGGDSPEIELGALNVLIGPNASGKSNLIEALGLLKAAPRDILAPIREGGGAREWLWKGSKQPPVADINVTISNPEGSQPLRYRLAFTVDGQEKFELTDEAVENETPYEGRDDPYFYYRFQRGRPVLNVREELSEPSGSQAGRAQRNLEREEIDVDQSVLSQRKDPDRYPEITFVGNILSGLAFYREWNFGRYTPPRTPQKVDLPEDFLLEDASNLVLVLNDLEHRAGSSQAIVEKLQTLDDRIDHLSTKLTGGGTIQLYLREKGLGDPAIPATRLSDGTLRYLCLLAVLCHPSPPPVVCIEEPEIGLHPDALQTVAELLVDASTRTQLIVTTHSDILVSALSETPESVLVCEKTEGGTELRRLEKDTLSEWLDKYSLGDLWRMGEIGGNRW